MGNKLNITKVNNGFLIDWKQGWNDEGINAVSNMKVEKKVIEEKNNDKEDCLKRLLSFVSEYFKDN